MQERLLSDKTKKILQNIHSFALEVCTPLIITTKVLL